MRNELLAVVKVLKRVYDMKQDGNAGAYYKLAGELFVLGEDCEVGMCKKRQCDSHMMPCIVNHAQLPRQASRFCLRQCRFWRPSPR